jgi:hypothetical protein
VCRQGPQRARLLKQPALDSGAVLETAQWLIGLFGLRARTAQKIEPLLEPAGAGPRLDALSHPPPKTLQV